MWPVAPLAALLGAVCGVAAWWGVNHHRAGLIIVMGLVVAFPFVIRFLQDRWDPFEPIHIVAVSVGVLFVARPIAEIAYHLTDYGPYYAPPGFTAAMWVAIGGTASLYAGYFAPYGARLARKIVPLANTWDRDRSVKFALRTIGLALFLTAGYVAAIGGLHVFINSFKGRSGQAGFVLLQQGNAYFAQGPFLTIPISFILLAAWQQRRSVFVGVLLFSMVALALLETVPSGDRTFILQLVMPLIVMWYLRRNRRPKVINIAIVVFITVIAANVLVDVRNIQTRSQHPLVPTIVNAITHPGNEIKKFMTGADPSEFTVLEVEVHQLNSPSFMTFHPGATIGSIAVGPIPRHLIGTKPMSGLEHVTYDLFPATRTARASFGPSWLGDLYDDDGWLTVVFFCALIGLALRVVWEYFRRNSQSLGMQMMLAVLTPMLIVLVRNSLTDVIARSIFMIFPIVLCVFVCSRPPRYVRNVLRRRGKPSSTPYRLT